MGFFEPVTELFKLIKELVLWLFAKKRLNEQRKLYLERCLSHTEHLGEDWISDAKEGQTRLRLDAAFVLVNLLDARGGDVTLREVLGHQRCVVLQGPPGAGKSTLVRFITRVMASALLPGSDPSLAERRLALLPHFPIRIPLKSYDQSKDRWPWRLMTLRIHSPSSNSISSLRKAPCYCWMGWMKLPFNTFAL